VAVATAAKTTESTNAATAAAIIDLDAGDAAHNAIATASALVDISIHLVGYIAGMARAATTAGAI
jgi:hypothetical protein